MNAEKNVKVIFTDTDYELVTKAYEKYDMLTENYQFKSAVLELSSLIAIVVGGYMIMFILFAVTDDTFAGSTVAFTAAVLSIILVALSGIYNKKNKTFTAYRTDCFNVKRNMEEFKENGNNIHFGMDILCDELFYDVCNPDYEYRRHISSVANEIPDAYNIILKLKETTDKHEYVSYVWQVESEEF